MRQKKNGFPAVKIDTDLFEQEATKAIINKYGGDGFTTLIFAILAIFKGEGYYLYLNDDFIDYTANQTGIRASTVINVINMAVDIGLFDSDVFEKFSILTNIDLQKQYISEFRTRKRPVEIESSIWLIGYDFKKDYIAKDTLMADKHFKVPYKQIETTWNKVAEKTGIPKVKASSVWSSSRKKHVAALVKRYGVDEVLSTIERIEKSDFLIGKNNRKWKIKFSWFLESRNFEKISEGNYDNQGKTYQNRFSGANDLSEYL